MDDKLQLGMAFVLAVIMMAYVMAGVATAIIMMGVAGLVAAIIAILVKFGDKV